MSDLIISTVGTSFLSKYPAQSGPKRNVQRAVQRLKGLDPSDKLAGAEVNSVTYMLAGKGLRDGPLAGPVDLVFLVSDTDDGRFMGEVLCRYFKGSKTTGKGAAECAVVEGLRPDDPKRFARVGLRNLVKLAADCLKRHPGGRRYINATGGFKAQISFACLIGQTLGVPVAYAFELFPCCIELPPMPVDFDRELWLTHYDLFLFLSQEACAAAGEFAFADVDPRIRELLDHEDVDGQECFSLSPMLELMHQGFLSRWPIKPKEPAASAVAPAERVQLSKAELPHHPPGTERLAAHIAALPWVEKVRDHTPRMNTQRTHLLNRDAAAPWAVTLVYAHDAQPQGAVRLTVHTTASNEAEVAYVRERIAKFLAEM